MPEIKKFQVDLGKIQAKRLRGAISDLHALHSSHIEIRNFHDWKTGEIKEDRTRLWAFPCDNRIEEVDKLYEEIGQRYEWKATKLNVNQIIGDLEEATKKGAEFLPIQDNRKTPEQFEEIKKRQAEENQKRAEYTAKCTPIPEGKKAVCLSVCVDNTDLMTDYFDQHHCLERRILAFIDKKAKETESIARSIVRKYPDLDKIEWEWNTEKYSGGHGNYLTSKTCPETRTVKDSRGFEEEDRPCHYEIEFLWGGDYISHSDFDKANEPLSTSRSGNGDRPEIRHNQDKDGLEIIFESKPDQSIIDWLKGEGFRWSIRNRLWFKSFSPELQETAENFFQGA